MFTDESSLGKRNIIVLETVKESFAKNIYRLYIQSVVDHITSRLKSSDVYSAFSIFNPSHLPETEDSLSSYGTEKLQILTKFYGSPQKITFKGQPKFSVPDIDMDQTEAEWKIFRRILFTNFREANVSYVLTSLLQNDTLKAGFPNLERLASIAIVLPVTTATVERSFSDMKLIKTRLRNRLGEYSLDQAMRVCIEGPERLTEEMLELIIDNWKDKKNRKIIV